jgi:hypothetical protein
MQQVNCHQPLGKFLSVVMGPYLNDAIRINFVTFTSTLQWQ